MATKVFSTGSNNAIPDYIPSINGLSYGDDSSIRIQSGHTIGLDLPLEGNSLNILIPEGLSIPPSATHNVPLRDRDGNAISFPQDGGLYEFIRAGGDIFVYKKDGQEDVNYTTSSPVQLIGSDFSLDISTLPDA